MLCPVDRLRRYCIFNRDDILRFAFDCFDLDSSGTSGAHFKQHTDILYGLFPSGSCVFATFVLSMSQECLTFPAVRGCLYGVGGLCALCVRVTFIARHH